MPVTGGSALEAFTTFMASTGPSYLTSAEQLVNEVQKRSYLFRHMLMGRDPSEVIQGGTKIKDMIYMEGARTFTRYKTGGRFQWQNPQTAKTIEVPWRFGNTHMSWTDQELMLNMGDAPQRGHLRGVFKKVKKQKEQNMWTETINAMEEELWASPHGASADMESADGLLPYSIPAFVTEDTTAWHGSGWTTIQGLDPATNEKWRNAVRTYDADDPGDTDGDQDGLFDAFEHIWLDLKFKSPGFKDEHFSPSAHNRCLIVCSRVGWVLYKALLRDQNDHLTRWGDPSGERPSFYGVFLEFIEALDTALLYDDGSSGFTDEASASKDGPRFYFLNFEYLKIIWHRERYWYEHEVKQPSDQVDSWVKPVSVWNNLFLRSRQRQGIVAPAA